MNKKEQINPSLEQVIDYGQGDDEVITELFINFKKLRDGYYGLVNNGNDWWTVFNQGIEFDREMAKIWESIDKNTEFMEKLTQMGMLMTGAYIHFDDFVDGLSEIYKKENPENYYKITKSKEDAELKRKAETLDNLVNILNDPDAKLTNIADTTIKTLYDAGFLKEDEN